MFEIRGTVTESGLGGIAGVEVRAYAPRTVTAASLDPVTGRIPLPEPSARTFTNARGEFTLSLPGGEYEVQAGRDGYIPTKATGQRQKLDAEHPKGEAAFEMARLAQITGRVLDDATGEPIQKLQVVLQNPRNRVEWVTGIAGRLSDGDVSRILGTPPGVTDDRGAFQIMAPPGSYLVGILGRAPQVGAAYSVETAKTIDSEYEQVYWPGGLPLADVQPMQLGSGAVMNLGEMRLKKVQRYRVHIVLPQGACPEGESVRLVIAQRGVSEARTAGAHKCGSDVVLQGFEPGSYGVYAVSDWQGERDNVEDAVWGQAEFDIKKENAEVTVDLHHGVVLEGQLKAAEGFAGSPGRIAIVSRPRDALFGSSVGSEEFIEWGENGRFRMAVGPGRQTLQTIIEMNKAYVSSVVFNGAPVREMTIDAKSGEKQRLEIELGNKLGTIEGTSEGTTPYVHLRRNGEFSMVTAQVISGTFRIAVPLGEYRVAEGIVPLERIDLVGEKVVVKVGETATVKVRRVN